MAHGLRHAHARLFTSSHSGTTRILLLAICESPTFTAPLPHSQDLLTVLRPLLAAHAFWDVYADGSWYPAADSAESLLVEAATHIGGCSCIFAPSTTALETGLIVLRVDARALSRVDGGSPRMMELVVITSGLILLHSLGRTYRRTTDTSL